ncbi:MAG: glutamyl-tRNA reductase [Bacteroidetes bacterium]|nr:glutamyl-tRNA reductase [Bacteroidota bacterium]
MREEHFYIVAVSHKNFSLSEIGKLHLEEEHQQEILNKLKTDLGLKELLYLSTCNRVAFLFVTPTKVDASFLTTLFCTINTSLKRNEQKKYLEKSKLYAGHKATEYILSVASSLDSLVVGEREIITQFRFAYEKCQQIGLTGDFMRLLARHTIETAKQVFTETDIAKNPVSVMSLACRLLRERNIKDNARCVFIGAGQTNATMAKYLKKHHFSTFVVFNRSLQKAKNLADELGGEAYMLAQTKNYTKGFDVLITCTGSSENLVTPTMYQQLLQGEKDKKIIIDLAVPVDIHPQVLKDFNIDYISVNEIKKQARENIALRKKEIKICEQLIAQKVLEFKSILHERKVELAFGEIPQKIKEIHNAALTEVFAKDLNHLDDASRHTVEKIMSYLEKKYNAVAITTAKKVFLNQN